MNCQVLPVDNEPASPTSAVSHIVNLCRPAPPTAGRDGQKSEVWSGLRKNLERIGIPPISIDSLALVPLVETAVDDRVITPGDKERFFAAMRSLRLLTSGIDPGLTYLVEAFKGRTEFLIVWTVYLRDIVRRLQPKQRAEFEALTIESCRFMIRTIGGFLRVRNLETRIMAALRNAFDYRMA